MAAVRDETTELEAHALSLILRCPSLTAYQLRQSFAESPTRLIAMSQGTVYPLVQRLKKRGFIEAEEVQGDGRRASSPAAVQRNRSALRAWLWRTDLAIPEDPLRSKVLILGVLTQPERQRWAKTMRAQLLEALADFEDFAEANPGPLLQLAHDNARTSLLARIRWVERVMSVLEGEEAISVQSLEAGRSPAKP
jgi:DNA-binding PadR family transcriptional regulator